MNGEHIHEAHYASNTLLANVDKVDLQLNLSSQSTKLIAVSDATSLYIRIKISSACTLISMLSQSCPNPRGRNSSNENDSICLGGLLEYAGASVPNADNHCTKLIGTCLISRGTGCKALHVHLSYAKDPMVGAGG